MNMYTLESLKEINNRFCRSHEMTEYDVEKVNEYVELIENSRSKLESKIGDMIQYTNEYGEYFEKAHIDEIYEDGELYICERPYVPFVGINENNNGISCSTSGGAWEYLSKEKLTYVGKSKKRFCVWGNCGASCEVAYSTTKGAINTFTKALAKELAPSNIQVNGIACGIIDTKMNSHLDSEDIASIIEEIPVGRLGTPEDVAKTVYSISEAGSYLTGQIITLDGGWTS